MIAHQKLIKDQMEKEDAHNLFGRWWEKVDTDIKKDLIVNMVIIGVLL